jgi:GDPmannose 4,6-dehydratase
MVDAIMSDNSRVALITGISGQDSSYLADLPKKEYPVHGVVRRTNNLLRSRIEHLCRDERLYGKRLFLRYGDLSEGPTLRCIFTQARPVEVYPLAEQSHVGSS